MKLEPVVLEGEHVRLEPLAMSHVDALWEAGADPELWRLIPSRVTSRDEMAAYVRSALDAQAAGSAMPFATVDRKSGKVAGSTRYGNIDLPNKHVEIGWTWIAREHQRSRVNTEAKLLMLRHAFETLGCIRVELKTDSLNRRSRNAIQRLGAKPEGVFRNHMQTWSGRVRHTAWFSIVDTEWPDVKRRLEGKLANFDRLSAGPRRVDTLSDSQVEDLHRLFQNEWWTKDRTLEDVRRMLDGSAVTVGFVDPKTDRLLAFMRAITDGVYKVLLLDLVVDPAARKTGLGKKTFEAVLEHPALRDAKHFELYCRPELMTLYRRWGFEELPADIRAMRRVSG